MADGTIRVSTKLDNTQLKKEIKELERELNNISKEQAKVEAEAAKVRAAYDAEREFDAQFPEEFSHREDIDKRAAAELDKLNQKQDELNRKEREYQALLDAKNAKLSQQQAILEASKELDASMAGSSAASKITSQAQYNSLLDATVAKMQAMEIEAERIAAKTGLAKDEILKANPAYQKLVNTMKMLQAQTGKFGAEAAQAGKKAETAMKKARNEADKLTKSAKRGTMGFGRMQLAMFGIMFAMRAISAATQEYMAVNTELEGQLNTLKALWGQVLGPAIEWVVNLLIQAISAINAFVYALTGINYVAKANEAALKKQAQATSSAAKAAQLAGFDEQTKLTDTSSSAADKNPVATLPDGLDEYLDDIEALKTKLKELADETGFTKMLEKVREGLENIKTGVGTISEAWSNAVATSKPKIDDMKESVEAAFLQVPNTLSTIWGDMWLITTKEFEDWCETHQVEIETFFTGLIEVVSGNTALLADAIAEAFEDLETWWNEDGKTIFEDITGAIGDVAAWCMQIYNKVIFPVSQKTTELLDELWGKHLRPLWNELLKLFSDIGHLFKTLWDKAKPVVDWLIENCSPAFEGLFGGLGELVSGALGIVSDSLTSILSIVRFVIRTLTNIANGDWSAIWEDLKDTATTNMERSQSSILDFWEHIKGAFTIQGDVYKKMQDGISGTFKSSVNQIIEGANSVISKPFGALNTMLQNIRDVKILGYKPFGSISMISIPKIPKLAVGGIVNRPGRGVPAIIGESGAEAVLPLENNTEWMDILADKIGGNVTIPIYLDGKKMYTYIVDIGKRKAFAANGG